MNSFGNIFRFTSFGESHGAAIGGVIDGCPAGVAIDMDFIQSELSRRATGQNAYASQRKEADAVEFLSGIYEGVTLGTPIGFIIRNTDARSSDYEALRTTYRPGHADEAYDLKYGRRDHRGGGRASARETAARVVAGAVAKLYLRAACPTLRIQAQADIDETALEAARQAGDSLGGFVCCRISGLPAGYGEPIFDKLQARLAYAMMSINACKGFEYGEGFAAATMRGSEHNKVQDGLSGGISTGADICFRLAFKPTPSIGIRGRHDICFVPRVPVIVEAMTALVLADSVRCLTGSVDKGPAARS